MPLSYAAIARFRQPCRRQAVGAFTCFAYIGVIILPRYAFAAYFTPRTSCYAIVITRRRADAAVAAITDMPYAASAPYTTLMLLLFAGC